MIIKNKRRLAVLGALALILIGVAFCTQTTKGLSSAKKEERSSSAEKTTPLLTARKRVDLLKSHLQKLSTIEEKKNYLFKETSIRRKVHQYPEVAEFVAQANPKEAYVLGLTAALNQFDLLFDNFASLQDKQSALRKFVALLVEMENFYQPMGGLLGYYDTVLKLLDKPADLLTKDQFVPPPFQDMREKTAESWKLCYEGVRELPKIAYIFPIGGASDRLNLIDEVTKEQLPAAAFIFTGRTLFELLVRDVLAQEYWHYVTFGKQIVSPMVLMTSMDKNNDKRIADIGEKGKWFGHRPDSFFRMIQPQVLLIDFDGNWVSNGPLNLVLKPGGHGVIWKLAQDSGAFRWLQERKVDTMLVRQINNPLASLDNTLFTLAGYGMKNAKAFGFASCPARAGFAEGLNILSIRPKEGAAISNIEYTFFKTLKETHPTLFENSSCPANTNVLFAYIPAIEKALSKDPIPGLIINPKTSVEVTKNGIIEKKMAARLESSMQNIAECFRTPIDLQSPPEVQKKTLQTFLNLYDRDKLISVTKRAFVPGQSPYETPESCYYDWTRAMRKLLTDSCGFNLPPEQTLEQFLEKGPEFTFLFNPALGPLWEVIGQKFSNGTLAPGAEIELEIAELACNGLTVDGSFRILADRVVGKKNGAGTCSFSDKVGRVRMKNCIIINQGVDSRSVQSFIKGNPERKESCEFILQGFSELIAENVTIKGNFHLVVPDGKRARLTQDSTGKLLVEFEDLRTPGWKYKINWKPSEAPKLLLVEETK